MEKTSILGLGAIFFTTPSNKIKTYFHLNCKWIDLYNMQTIWLLVDY